MKTPLRLIATIGILWCVALGIRHMSFPAHFMLDAILPASVIAKTNAEERTAILANLSRHTRPSIFSWICALSVTALSFYSLAGNDTPRKRGMVKMDK